MRFVYFTHALSSCWNHGNAHFQRGILRALTQAGHDAVAWEPAESWSRTNLVLDQGASAVDAFGTGFPGLTVHRYAGETDLPRIVQNAEIVIVHEWTDPVIVAALGDIRRRGGRFTLLFHDTHHRAVSEPAAIRAFDLSGFDGVLAFGEALARVYEDWGWGSRVFVWHEAADTALFHPPATPQARHGAVWIGNWGDGERTRELQEFLLIPAKTAGVALDVHGVRYPQEALVLLADSGARYHGWVANARVPALFAQHAMTVHVPRRFYTGALPGIPTIRMFEAMACGIPLICAPWNDTENLFRTGEDYRTAQDGAAMARHMRDLAHDPAAGAAQAASGLARIREHHSCDVRAAELIDILGRLAGRAASHQGAA